MIYYSIHGIKHSTWQAVNYGIQDWNEKSTKLKNNCWHHCCINSANFEVVSPRRIVCSNIETSISILHFTPLDFRKWLEVVTVCNALITVIAPLNFAMQMKVLIKELSAAFAIQYGLFYRNLELQFCSRAFKFDGFTNKLRFILH